MKPFQKNVNSMKIKYPRCISTFHANSTDRQLCVSFLFLKMKKKNKSHARTHFELLTMTSTNASQSQSYIDYMFTTIDWHLISPDKIRVTIFNQMQIYHVKVQCQNNKNETEMNEQKRKWRCYQNVKWIPIELWMKRQAKLIENNEATMWNQVKSCRWNVVFYRHMAVTDWTDLDWGFRCNQKNCDPLNTFTTHRAASHIQFNFDQQTNELLDLCNELLYPFDQKISKSKWCDVRSKTFFDSVTSLFYCNDAESQVELNIHFVNNSNSASHHQSCNFDAVTN